VIPVYNEELVLERSVERLRHYLATRFPFSWRITIVDNASTDSTWRKAVNLAARLDGVRALHLDRKGRGAALRAAWSANDAAVVAYMDVDLSTDLDALLPLVAPLVSGHSDIAVGSRLAPASSVARAPKREFISRTYNLVLRTVMATRVRDAQCGFKAVRSDIARRLVPAVVDDGWFFDTELLLLAERNGLRIHEVPVDWVDDPDSRVQIAHTAWKDLEGTARMFRTFASGRGKIDFGPAARLPLTDDFGRRLVSFGLIGLGSTLVSLVLFLALRPLGPVSQRGRGARPSSPTPGRTRASPCGSSARGGAGPSCSTSDPSRSRVPHWSWSTRSGAGSPRRCSPSSRPGPWWLSVAS
jgi:hypothetical protein